MTTNCTECNSDLITENLNGELFAWEDRSISLDKDLYALRCPQCHEVYLTNAQISEINHYFEQLTNNVYKLQDYKKKQFPNLNEIIAYAKKRIDW